MGRVAYPECALDAGQYNGYTNPNEYVAGNARWSVAMFQAADHHISSGVYGSYGVPILCHKPVIHSFIVFPVRRYEQYIVRWPLKQEALESVSRNRIALVNDLKRLSAMCDALHFPFMTMFMTLSWRCSWHFHGASSSYYSREDDVLPDPQGNLIVTIQVSFSCAASGGGVREKGGEWKPPRLPCPAPRQEALQAPWNPLLNSYIWFSPGVDSFRSYAIEVKACQERQQVK